MTRIDPYKLTVAVLTLLALALFAYPCLRVGTPLEIDYNEGWNAHMQLKAMTGASLYGNDTPFILNNYPPLSFYLIGLLGKVVGDVVLAGRLVSLAAVLLIAASAHVVARAAGARPWDALLSAATALGLLSGLAADYVGTNDPQLLAQSLLCVGFALYVRRDCGAARLPLVALLFAAGLMTKHNVLALPLVATIHLMLRGGNRERALFLGSGAVLAAAALAVIQWKFGPGFFRALLAGREYDPARGILLSTEMLDMLQAPLAVVGLYFLLARDGRIATKVGWYLGAGLALAFGFSGGAGVDTNVFFDPMIACAMGAGPAVAWLRGRPGMGTRACAALALAVHAGLIFHAPIALGRFGVDMAGEMAERERLFLADVDWLRQMPDPVICESMLLCLRAGKPVWIDTYAAAQGAATGRLPKDALPDMLARGEVAVVQVSSRPAHHADDAEGAQSMPPRFINVADDVFDTLDRRYELRRVGLMGRFYTPR